uniref:(northern house mosquito) hypothetical protein n=1 Tax=Culex pipiens TaxID=7175 RepID=A0A8D8DC73_CULPI
MSPPNTWHVPWKTRSANPPKTKKGPRIHSHFCCWRALDPFVFDCSSLRARLPSVKVAMVVVMVGEDNRLKLLQLHCLQIFHLHSMHKHRARELTNNQQQQLPISQFSHSPAKQASNMWPHHKLTTNH